jgi:hypothetical protein
MDIDEKRIKTLEQFSKKLSFQAIANEMQQVAQSLLFK